MGCDLLRRSTHHVELTLAGEALLDRARGKITQQEQRVDRPAPSGMTSCRTDRSRSTSDAGLVTMMRSAWLKWARGVEHQQVLARAMRERQQAGAWNRYERCDNASDHRDPFVRVHWHLAEAEPIPERWGVLLGDVFTNFRAALDHGMWTAVSQHSGPPERAEDVQFPIAREANRMRNPRQKLRPLVGPAVWKIVEEVQPYLLEDPQRHPLETLRWASNVDKHRFLHVAARAFVDAGHSAAGYPRAGSHRGMASTGARRGWGRGSGTETATVGGVAEG